MGKVGPRYSVLICKEKIDKSISKDIVNYLTNGIKVYLITSSKKKGLINILAYEKEKLILKAKENMILNLYEDIFISKYYDGNIYYDGKINNDDFYTELLRSNFNIEQYRIEHEDISNNIIVKSGAGTGKTKVMVDRVMFLKHMKEGLDLLDIIMITFTKEATKQMREKLGNIIETYYQITKDKKYLKWLDELSYMKIMTIHSYAKNILEETGRELGIPSSFNIRSYKYEKRRIIEKYIDKYNSEFPENYKKIEAIPQYIIIRNILKIDSFLDNRSIDIQERKGINLGEDSENFNHFLEYLLANLNSELLKIKKDTHSWEITDLMKHLSSLKEVKDINSKARFKYLMIDEFQDTDVVQVRFVLWLFEEVNCKLFVVGDIKQSIYRFRGADYTAFSQLINGLKQLDTKNITEHNLTKNYRSCKEILNPINNLFFNIGRKDKQFIFTKNDYLESMWEIDNPYGFIINETKTHLGRVKVIKDILNRKGEEESIAILVRTNEDVKYITDLCEQNNIYCESSITGNFFRHISVREFYLLVRALIYSDDSLVQYALHNSSYGGSNLKVNDILDNFETDKDYLGGLLIKNKHYEEWSKYFEKVNKVSIMNLLIEIIENKNPAKTYALNMLKKSEGIDSLSKIEILESYNLYYAYYEKNLEHLIYLIQKNFSDDILTINEIEKYLRIGIETNDEESVKKVSDEVSKNKVFCMTIHKAKGLEFDYVYIPITDHQFISYNRKVQMYLSEGSDNYSIGYKINMDSLVCKNNYFNEIYEKEKKEIVGEEIRLFYVALTRAKKGLYIYEDRFINRKNHINRWMDILTWR